MTSEKDAFLQAIQADRYDWTTRKVFADWLEDNGFDDEAVVQRKWTPEKQGAEDWLREEASQHSQGYEGESTVSYEDLIQAGHDWINHEDYFTQYGQESLRDEMHGPKLEQFWRCWELVTGVTLDGSRQMESPFSCSC